MLICSIMSNYVTIIIKLYRFTFVKETMKNKIKLFISRLNFRKAIELTWSVSKKLTITTAALLILENVFWLGSIYMLKKLVDVVSRPEYLNKKEELIHAVLAAGIISVGYACVKSLSAYFT